MESFSAHLWKEEYAEAAMDYERTRVSSIKLVEQLKRELEVYHDQILVSEIGPSDKKVSAYGQTMAFYV